MPKSIRMTEERLRQHQLDVERRRAPAPGLPAEIERRDVEKKPKYKNRKVVIEGITFDSSKEAARWKTLCMWQAAGHIVNLRRQVAYELAPAVLLAGEARKKPALRYWADFVYETGGREIVEDVKSKPTRMLPAYRIKKHLLKTVHDLDIKEV